MHRTSQAEGSSSLDGRSVLIADDDAIIRHTLTMSCRDAGLRVSTATNGVETLLRVAKERPDLLILDLNLPDATGFTLCERLAADVSLPPLPVIILTAHSDQAAIKRCEDHGTFYVHKGPRAWEQIEFLIQRIFRRCVPADRRSSKHTPLVLLVDDDPVVVKTLAAGLGALNIDSMVAYSGMQALWLALTKQPDIVVTDCHMPMGNGRYLLQRMRNTEATQHISVVMLTGRALSEGERSLLERDLKGQAAGVLFKPLSADELLQELRRHVPLLAEPKAPTPPLPSSS